MKKEILIGNPSAGAAHAALRSQAFKILVVEAGCGAAISSALLSEPGASEVFDSGIIAYSRESQAALATNPDAEQVRAVSVENCLRLYQGAVSRGTGNVYCAATWTLGPIPHGYICVGGDHSAAMYHISLPVNHAKERSELYGTIGSIACAAIAARFGTQRVPVDYADSILEITRGLGEPPRNIGDAFLSAQADPARISSSVYRTVSNLAASDRDYVIMIDSCGPMRPVDAERFLSMKAAMSGGLTFYRGSFNPLSQAHLAIAKDTNAILLISMDTYDKGQIDHRKISVRVARAIEAGLTCAVVKSWRFVDSMYMLRECGYNKPMRFVIGSDTLRRIVESSGPGEIIGALEETNSSFLLVNRKNRDKVYEYEIPAGLEFAHRIQTHDKTYDFPSSSELRDKLQN